MSDTDPRIRLSDALARMQGICEVLTLLGEADTDNAHAPALLYLAGRFWEDLRAAESAWYDMREKGGAAERRWR